MKYSDQVVDWLVEEGYTHCFFVAGGNIMHLLDSARTRVTCIPFVHEVAATVAAEYFTQTSEPGGGKAFVMVTAGPGITNALTGMAGAWLDSRELLVIGGQVKRSDLADGGIRQRGIQEVDGLRLAAPVCKRVLRVEVPEDRATIVSAVREGATPRKGPVFIEMCLDAQAASPVDGARAIRPSEPPALEQVADDAVARVVALAAASERPVILLGGGVTRETARAVAGRLAEVGIPVMLTWNGADRLPTDHPVFAGRPNTWGQRFANVGIQQADLVIAIGARLGLQQTGFAWEDFAPLATVVHVDIDGAELAKGRPSVDVNLRGDANAFLPEFLGRVTPAPAWDEWRSFLARVRAELPLNDPQNVTAPGYVPPYELMMRLAEIAGEDDIIIPCSSGGALTVTMQALQPRGRQRVVINTALASMGYGLSGAIGASLANPGRRTFLTEGDGGFAQNLQELGTVAVNRLPLKILLLANDGYASIRMTQRNYFNGSWVGCDSSTGLGLPDWGLLASAYKIPYARMDPTIGFGGEVGQLLVSNGPSLIEVPIDPEQTYFPKIMSAVQADGSMKSNPLHVMHPLLDERTGATVLQYMAKREEGNE